jgi:hypothetical protein
MFSGDANRSTQHGPLECFFPLCQQNKRQPTAGVNGVPGSCPAAHHYATTQIHGPNPRARVSGDPEEGRHEKGGRLFSQLGRFSVSGKRHNTAP